MSPLTIFGDEREEYQLVVVLQDQQALWFRWRGQELVGSWSEPVTADSVNTQSLCPWVINDASGPECQVRLVFDTGLDEVDRVKAESLPRGWMQAVQRRRMARRLQTDYPLATIHLLPDYASPDVLSIVHHLIPANWEEWLRQLQSQDVCITHAVTSLELFCECSQDWPLSGVAAPDCVEKNDGPVLFNVPVGNDRRHLLVDGGVPLFMRMVVMPGEVLESGEISALQESLQHARDQITHDERTPPVLAPLPPWPELEPYLQSASVLAALCVGCPVNLQRGALSSGCELAPVTEPGETGLQTASEPGCGSVTGKVLQAVGNLLHRRDRQQRWSLTDGLRFSSDFLQPSIMKNRLQLRIRQLQWATLVCACLAAGSVVIASTHGINSAREKARLSTEQRWLSGQIDQLVESVAALNDAPGFVVRSLARIDAHESVKPVEASSILAMVAGAINEFPAIELNSLSWTVLSDNQSVDLAFAAMSQVPEREQLWHLDTAAPRLQVDISGTVTDQQGLGLRERQRELRSFVDHLQTLPEVVEVEVLKAPVNAARSSDQMADEGSGYHLSLQLGVF